MLRSLFGLFLCLLTLSCPGGLLSGEALNFSLYSQGKYVYERNCLLCHGARGDGLGELAKGLVPMPRSFREGMFKFRSTPYGQLPTDEDLRRTITGGLSGTAMGMFSQLAAEDVAAVLVYVKSFSRRWRKAENHSPPLALPEALPEWWTEKAERLTHAKPGAMLYANVCATCHGPKADGQGPTAPTLKDIWGFASRPSDLRQPHLRSGDNPVDHYRVISTGMSGTPMIGYEGTLTAEQRWDILAFLDTLKLPAVPTL